MTTRRHGQAGVTLIEMLAALAVSALIGLAGFSLLESVVRTERGVAGHLDQLLQQDRAFQLLSLDLQKALGHEIAEEGELVLRFPNYDVRWRGSETGLFRGVFFPDRAEIIQRPLDERASLTFDRGTVETITLSLPEQNIWRIFRLPTGTAP